MKFDLILRPCLLDFLDYLAQILPRNFVSDLVYVPERVSLQLLYDLVFEVQLGEREGNIDGSSQQNSFHKLILADGQIHSLSQAIILELL